MSKKLLITILIASCLLLFAEQVVAKTFTVGLEPFNHPPYFYVEDYQPKGNDVELLTKAFQRLGYKVKWEVLSSPMLMEGFINGQIDFKYPANANWEIATPTHNELIYYSKPLHEVIDGIFVPAQTAGTHITQYHTIGILSGYQPVALKNYIKEGLITLREYPDVDSLFQAVNNGEVQGAYLNHQLGEYYLLHDKDKKYDLVFDANLPTFTLGYDLATIKHPEILAKINTLLEHRR